MRKKAISSEVLGRSFPMAYFDLKKSPLDKKQTSDLLLQSTSWVILGHIAQIYKQRMSLFTVTI